MSSVIATGAVPVPELLPPPIEAEPLALPATETDAVEATGGGLGWRKVVVAITAAGVLLTGGCKPLTGGHDTNPGSPAAGAEGSPLPTLGPADHLLPAQMGKIPLGVVIARVQGDNHPRRGYTATQVVNDTKAAEQQITKATAGAVTFATPKFYGSFTVPASNSAQLCGDPDGSQGAKVGQFGQSFGDNTIKAAEKAGYNLQDNAGLVIYADYNCPGVYVRSSGKSDSPRGKTPEADEGRMIIESDPAAPGNSLVPVHELGHVLGQWHANLDNCSRIGIVLPPPDCAWQEYNDPRSVMGIGMWAFVSPEHPKAQATFNGYELLALGAIPRDKVGLIEQPGQYEIDLAGIQSGRDGLQLLRIPITEKLPPGGKDISRYYWVMLSRTPRTPLNPGNCTTTGQTTVCEYPQPWSLTVYEADDGIGLPGESNLIPLSGKNSPTVYGAGVAMDGQIVFQDPASGITIRLDEVKSNGHAGLTITYGKPFTTPVPRD